MGEIMMKIKQVVLLFIGIIGLAGCTIPFLLSPSGQDSEAVAAQKATIVMQITMTADAKMVIPSDTPIPSIVPTSVPQCAYVWAVNPDTDLNDQLTDGLSSTLMDHISLSTSWYGENCLDVDNNVVISFTAMNLELTVSFSADDEQTDAWKGEQIVATMNEVLPLLEKTADLANYPLVMHFVFQQDDGPQYLNFTKDTYLQFHEDAGLNGEALLAALLS